ncbi:MAG: hypothetical protein P8X81_00450 [Woeseiaceae bacterium]|jgi:hypothetical protein
MLIFRVLLLAVILAGCGNTADPSAKYQYVGTYEHFATPMGSSVSVLMADGEKIKIVPVDDTSYINIPVTEGIPEMRISGTYGINGEVDTSFSASGGVFLVREIEYLGGGQDPVDTRNYPMLPDFFTVDGNIQGPLTLSELQIQFPDSLARYFNDEDRECFYKQVESRAADLGDPATMAPIRRVLIAKSQQDWEEMTNVDKRLQLARYVTSMALSVC